MQVLNEILSSRYFFCYQSNYTVTMSLLLPGFKAWLVSIIERQRVV